jgi:Tfp pilus assembly protein PilX
MAGKGGDMMRRGESGQAFIMLLIILAIGTLLVVPAMNLTSTSLKSSEIVYDEVRSLYAADGAQEYVLWKLRWAAWGSDLVRNVPETFFVDV